MQETINSINLTTEFDEFSLKYGEPVEVQYLIEQVIDGAKFQQKLGYPANAVEMLELLKAMYLKNERFSIAQKGYYNEINSK